MDGRDCGGTVRVRNLIFVRNFILNYRINSIFATCFSWYFRFKVSKKKKDCRDDNPFFP
jgi:hypothetical protein